MSDARFIADDDTPLLARGDRLLTRADVLRGADALLSALAAAGAQACLVQSDRSEDLLAAIDACQRTGADLFVAHTALARDEIERIVAAYGVGLILSEAGVETRPVSATRGGGRIHLMTSGTTGRPKIATHDLRALLARAQPQSARGPARWLLTYQPTGFAGLQVTLTAAATGALLIAPERRTPSGFLDAARRHSATHISGTPTFWRSFLMAGAGDLRLAQATMGGEAVDQATLDRVRAAFPDARITHTYASTEAGMALAVHDGREGFPSDWLDCPRGDVTLRIRDGYLQIKSPHAMRAYLNQPEQPMLDDGWLATRDRCEIHGDRVRIIGREDTVINVAGSKVYPLEIERFLLGQEGVAEARVYSTPNPISGFLVGADVVLTRAEGEAARARILKACRASLPSYQVPRIFRIVDEIATGASGKKA